MNRHRLLIAAVPVLGAALILAAAGLTLAPASARAAQAKAVSAQRAPAAPRTVKKAAKLIRQSAAQLTHSYAKGRAKAVCSGLTAKALKSLDGRKSCALKVRRATSVKRISKISIKKLVFRHNRAWVDVGGYLNGKPKQRLALAFKWERGQYRLDHSITTSSDLLS